MMFGRGKVRAVEWVERLEALRADVDAGRVVKIRGHLKGDMGEWRRPEFGVELFRDGRVLRLRIWPKYKRWVSHLFCCAGAMQACELLGVDRVRGADGIPVPGTVFSGFVEYRVVWSKLDAAAVRETLRKYGD